MNDVLDAAKDIKLPDISEFLKALKNKQLDIDARWEAYVAMVNNKVLNDIEPYSSGYIELITNNRNAIIGVFYIERYQTMLYPDMYENILDMSEFENWSDEAIQNWREAVLKSGKSGFTFDW